MIQLNKNSKSLAKAGIISAIYIALTLVLYPISFGAFQVRVSESLTLLPLIFPESIIGLTVGCLISNFFGNGVLDIVFGTLATLISAVFTYYIGKKIKNPKLRFFIGAFPPVIINAICVPFTFLLLVELKELYFISMLQIFIGQTISIYLVGALIYFPLLKILTKRISR